MEAAIGTPYVPYFLPIDIWGIILGLLTSPRDYHSLSIAIRTTADAAIRRKESDMTWFSKNMMFYRSITLDHAPMGQLSTGPFLPSGWAHGYHNIEYKRCNKSMQPGDRIRYSLPSEEFRLPQVMFDMGLYSVYRSVTSIKAHFHEGFLDGSVYGLGKSGEKYFDDVYRHGSLLRSWLNLVDKFAAIDCKEGGESEGIVRRINGSIIACKVIKGDRYWDTVFYPSGNFMSKLAIERGDEPSYRYDCWREDGTIETTTIGRDNRNHIIENYHDDEQLHSVTEYVEGMPHGIQQWWSLDGHREPDMIYNHGGPVIYECDDQSFYEMEAQRN